MIHITNKTKSQYYGAPHVSLKTDGKNRLSLQRMILPFYICFINLEDKIIEYSKFLIVRARSRVAIYFKRDGCGIDIHSEEMNYSYILSCSGKKIKSGAKHRQLIT